MQQTNKNSFINVSLCVCAIIKHTMMRFGAVCAHLTIYWVRRLLFLVERKGWEGGENYERKYIKGCKQWDYQILKILKLTRMTTFI